MEKIKGDFELGNHIFKHNKYGIAVIPKENIKEKTADKELLARVELLISEKQYYKKLANAYQGSCIEKSKIREIRDKAECMDYYCLNDVINDLNKLLGDDK